MTSMDNKKDILYESPVHKSSFVKSSCARFYISNDTSRVKVYIEFFNAIKNDGTYLGFGCQDLDLTSKKSKVLYVGNPS